MGRSKVWNVTVGEVADLLKSLGRDLATGETLTGTPTITIYDSSDVDVTSDFTIAGVQVNTVERTTEDGETIPIGKAVEFRLTASVAEGIYAVDVACSGSGGNKPKATPPVKLVVSGPGAAA